jgi:hypothetical protein
VLENVLTDENSSDLLSLFRVKEVYENLSKLRDASPALLIKWLVRFDGFNVLLVFLLNYT